MCEGHTIFGSRLKDQSVPQQRPFMAELNNVYGKPVGQPRFQSLQIDFADLAQMKVQPKQFRNGEKKEIMKIIQVSGKKQRANGSSSQQPRTTEPEPVLTNQAQTQEKEQHTFDSEKDDHVNPNKQDKKQLIMDKIQKIKEMKKNKTARLSITSGNIGVNSNRSKLLKNPIMFQSFASGSRVSEQLSKEMTEVDLMR